ncbi:MAG: F0F1 ATP synthase subunit I [Rhodobacteraceae bacterium]|nr:F0F1 ATP synthase subunit I [Paracoccaceae bacterium]
MTGPHDKNSLEALTARIEAAKSEAKPEDQAEDHHKAAQLAWRMVIELVAGLGIGLGIGYGLDVLFGTIPVFLVAFTMLGFIAGVRTMLRSAKEIQEKQMVELAQDEKDD